MTLVVDKASHLEPVLEHMMELKMLPNLMGSVAHTVPVPKTA